MNGLKVVDCINETLIIYGSREEHIKKNVKCINIRNEVLGSKI